MNEITWHENSNQQNNYLARIIGIIGEEISEYWLKNEQNKQYSNIGRPTIYWEEAGKNHRATLDFLIQDKNGSVFIVEQKNFFAYNKGKLRTIEDSPEFKKAFSSWHRSKSKATAAWKIFNSFEKTKYEVKCNGDSYPNISGRVLFWSEVQPEAKSNFLEYMNEMHEVSYHDVIGLVQMVHDLKQWQDESFKRLVNERMNWSNQLFTSLLA